MIKMPCWCFYDMIIEYFLFQRQEFPFSSTLSHNIFNSLIWIANSKQNTNHFTKMKFSKITLAFFIASTAITTSTGLSAESIKEVVGDGCSNAIKFQSFFTTDSGDTCSTCSFCDGSHLSSLFDPKVENICIDCGAADNSCNNLEVVTNFERPWLMKFMTLTSSSMGSEK